MPNPKKIPIAVSRFAILDSENETRPYSPRNRIYQLQQESSPTPNLKKMEHLGLEISTIPARLPTPMHQWARPVTVVVGKRWAAVPGLHPPGLSGTSTLSWQRLNLPLQVPALSLSPPITQAPAGEEHLARKCLLAQGVNLGCISRLS